jgi:hypothetical protein
VDRVVTTTGRMNTLLISLVTFVLLFWAVSAEAQPRTRTLLIGIDAIPYDLVKKLTDPALGDKALFKGLRGPAAVINTFPTGSYVAWTGLLRPLGSPKALGYEACHFKRAEAQLRGCFSVVKVPAPWREVFDWYLAGIVRKGLAYGWPRPYSVHEIEQGLTAFIESDKDVFGMYIVSTDALGHIYGPDALAQFLRELDEALRAFRAKYPDHLFRTVLVSDHGMAGGRPLKNTWPKIEVTLAKAGLRVHSALERASDVTIVKFGLLSGFVAYTWAGKEAEIASLLVSVPGVDLCIVQQDADWRVLSARGDALVSRRTAASETSWSYRSLGGDALGYQPVVAALQRQHGRPGQQWFADSLWFEASKNHFYPDALYRIAGAFELVENPASILCSNSPGYMFGSLVTEYASLPTIGALQWTHGALYEDASLGFLMTDVPDWPLRDRVRFDQALVPLARLAGRGALASTESARSLAPAAADPSMR